jgi:DNA-binding NarL/FixJ family response regulator
MSPAVARRVLEVIASLPSAPEPAKVEPLTPRELATLRELANGSTYLQAAATLEVSINTLRAHIRNIYRKLSVGTKTEAVMAGLRLGIVGGASLSRR